MKIQINARNRAHHFHSGAGRKILHAGLSNAIALPYECGSGTCGTCKARLLSGAIDDAWPQAPGRKFLKNPDEFLMCQCTARNDLSIEVASFVQTVDTGACLPAAIKGRIRDAVLLTRDVMELHVDLNEPMVFDAGQFVLIETPSVPGARGWSMVNHERGAKALQFIVKKKPDGKISDWLFGNDRNGAEVEVFGPLGSATFYPSIAKNLLCIAGGSGIAGIVSIITRAVRENHFADFNGNVFFGVRSMKDAFYLDTFSNLREQAGDKLAVTIALSEEAASEAMRAQYPLLAFESGFVHEVAGRTMQGRYDNVLAFLAGPPPAVDASVRMLLMARVSTSNIRYDKFS